MLIVSAAQLNLWISAFIWPLTRILGLFSTAPIFGNPAFPLTTKVALGVFVAMIIAPTVPPAAGADPFSMAGGLILVQEMLIGLGMGFVIRLVFGAVEFAGEISSLTMGLGFASFFDPSTQARSSAVSQFLALLASMAFIAANGHLVLLSALAESFVSMPVSATPMHAEGFRLLAEYGVKIFSAGLQLSLPIVAALLLTNIALGILTRAAPSLNLFGIGFPVTLGVGFIVIAATLPYLSGPMLNLFNQGIETSRALGRSWGAAPAPVPPRSQTQPAPTTLPAR